MVGKPSNPFDLGKSDHSETSEHFNEVLEASAPPVGRALFANAASTPPKLLPPASETKPGPWRWLLIGFGIFSLFGGISGAALWWLTTPPPSPDCQQISPLSPDMERLLCAQEAANSGDLQKVLAGMELLKQWDKEHPLYREAQRMIAEWSEPVLRAARAKMDQSDLRGAVELASQIPETSPLYADAQAEMAEWQRYWQQAEKIVTAARAAMKAQNWVLAAEKIAALKDFEQEYWRFDQADTLSTLLAAEQQGRQLLAQAKELAQASQPSQLGAAIARLSRINRGTYAWADAQPSLKQWSETLLALGVKHWQSNSVDTAIDVVRPVLQNPALAQTAQDLMWLSQSRKHTLTNAANLQPKLSHLWNLSAAIATAELIQPGSRYYTQAQANIKDWQAQIQDLTLLQLAWGIGEIPLQPAKQFAILQAQQIEQDRPRRAQAQSLIAYWTIATKQLEDRPYLTQARTIAKAGNIAAFQQAIAQAKLIALGRPLRTEAQTLIADWTRQIQSIEDQPLLDRAWALANQGNLNGAIQAANAIAPGRALYGQAQGAIANWLAEIRAAELARTRAQQAERQRKQEPQAPSVSSGSENPPDPYATNNPPEAPVESYAPAPPPITTPEPTPPSRPPRVTAPLTAPPAARPVYSPPTPPPPVYEPTPPAVLEPYAAPVYQPYEPPPPNRP